MKKKNFLVALLIVCMTVFFGAGVVVLAASDSFDGNRNLATDASLWNQSTWTVSNKYATIDENGIVFNEYGTSSAVAAVSLKELLPYGGQIKISFSSQVPDAVDAPVNGFLKVIFADASGSTNGNAMKPWEISAAAEHMAIEIKNNAVSLWHYNLGNESGKNNQLKVMGATKNYIDGEIHQLVLEYEVRQNDYKLKISIDDTLHYDDVIVTNNLYCQNVLTIGGYANSTVTDDLTISNVLIKKIGADPAPSIDKDNLLGQSDAWTLASDGGIVHVPSMATLSISEFSGGKAASLNQPLPSEAELKIKLSFTDVPTPAVHTGIARITLLSNEKQDVVLQFDDDENVWLQYKDYSSGGEGELIESAGEWIPGLLTSLNTIKIKITPELTDGNEGIYVSVSVGTKMIGLSVNNLKLMNGNILSFGSTGIGTIVFTDVRVKNLVQKKPETAIVTENLIEDAADWEYVSSVVETDVISLGGSDYLKGKKALPVGSTISFTVQATSQANQWYYFGLGNFHSTLWDGEQYKNGEARLRITTTGSQGFFTVDMNGQQVSTASANTTMLFDGTKQVFTFVSEYVKEGLKLTMLRNNKEEFSKVFALDSAFGSSKSLFLMFRATGEHQEAPKLTDITCSYVESVDVSAYNEAIETKSAIYGLTSKITLENALLVKNEALALIEKLKEYTSEQLEIVTNRLYAEFIINCANEVLDEEAAKVVIERISALNFAAITAENIEDAKVEIIAIKSQYEALTETQKKLVTNYDKIQRLETDIANFELAKTIVEEINALSFSTITAENVDTAKAVVLEIEKKYEALSADQKKYVENYDKITALKEAIADYEKSIVGPNFDSEDEKAGCSSIIASSSIIAFGVIIVFTGCMIMNRKTYKK